MRQQSIRGEAEAKALARKLGREGIGSRAIRPSKTHMARSWVVQVFYVDPDPAARAPTGYARLTIPLEDAPSYGINPKRLPKGE